MSLTQLGEHCCHQRACKCNYTWFGLNIFQPAVRSQINSQGALKWGSNTVWGHKVFRTSRTDSVSTHHYALCNWASGWSMAYFFGNLTVLLKKIVKILNNHMRNTPTCVVSSPAVQTGPTLPVFIKQHSLSSMSDVAAATKLFVTQC